MQQRILALVNALRTHGVVASPAEVADAFRALASLGVDPFTLRETLAACLVKSADDRPIFDTLFAKFFSFSGQRKSSRHQRSRQAGATGTSKQPSPEGALLALPARRTRKLDRSLRQLLASHEQHLATARRSTFEPSGNDFQDGAGGNPKPSIGPRKLVECSWRELDAADVDQLGPVLDKLRNAFKRRLTLRSRKRQRGALNFRATFRRAITTGGAFVDPVFHRRKPKHLDLLVLCDLSHSVAQASQFFLSCLAAAEPLFRRSTYYGFIDHAVELEVNAGAIRPACGLDFHARSDFGAVLTTMQSTLRRQVQRNTLLLVLGDGRNNFRPPAANVLAALAAQARALAWVQPEAPERWGTGDSAFLTYAKHCDLVVRASNPAELARELPRALHRWI